MKTAHRKASHHKRRMQADPSSIYRVMARVQSFTKEELTTLTLPPRISFEALRTGTGERQDFETLAVLANVCVIRGEDINPLCVEVAQRAQAALMRCAARHEKTGRWGFDGPALQELEVVIDLYEQMLELSTPEQMRLAMVESVRRMKDGQVVEGNLA